MAYEVSETDEFGFSDFWSNSDVHKEVLQGIKLRQKKMKYQSKECTPVDISVKRSKTSVTNITYNSRNKKFKAILSCYQSPLSPPLSTCYKKKKHRQCKISQCPRSKCPMRIAELAIPTKRQCLDTWRNRGNTLPNFMVDRLQQHVVDQKPVVQIHEAINCFQSRRNRNPRINTKKRKIKTDYKNIDRVKLFCALFAYKITRKLLPSRPIHGTNLRNLSDVINEEIAQLLGKKVKGNKYMQNEISNRVAVWIATILEDSYTKLMLDDFKDLEEKEGHVWDIIDDLVETVLENSKSNSILNLENSTSSLISTYSYKSTPRSNNASENDEYINLKSQDNTNDSLQSDETNREMVELILSNIIESLGDTQSLKDFIKSVLDDTVPENIRNDNRNNKKKDESETKTQSFIIPTNQIHSPIKTDSKNQVINDNNDTKHNFINKSEEISVGEDDGTQKLSSTENNYSVALLNELKSISNNNMDYIINDTNKDTTFTLEGSSKLIENIAVTSMGFEDNNIKFINSITNSGEEQQNVERGQTELHIENHETPINSQRETELFNNQENTIEESPDDSLKKVKFSDINIGNDRRIKDTDFERSIVGNIILDKKRSSSSSINNFKHISFSPPNSHLLYDVDESWPDDFLPPTNKVSASVSKSVTSLGFIKEADEKVTNSPDIMQNNEIINNYVAKNILLNSHDEPTTDTTDLHENLLIKIQNLNEDKETILKNNILTYT